MSAEPRRVTNTEAWTQWENQVVNGVFPLRRCLGCSDHSAVFLTEYKAGNLPDAAIKFLRADASHAKAQLVQWGTAAALSHPHLTRIFDVGRYRFGGHEFIFVVMEYAEQTLAQILSQRALNHDEVQEMLLPTLDALAFLHRNQLVHGQLKPSNILAINDQLKLASDTVGRAADSASGIVSISSRAAPELKNGGTSIAGDMWSLGMTLVEALTQRIPARSEATVFAASFPAPFGETVRRCLSPSPSNRPTVIELAPQYGPAARAQSTSDQVAAPDPQPDPQPQPQSRPQPSAHKAPRAATPPPSLPKRQLSLPVIAAAIVISLAVWAGLYFAGTSQSDLPPPVPAPTSVAPPAIEKSGASDSKLSSPVTNPPDQSAPPTATSLSVLHEVEPNVPPAIREKIQGRIYVTVRVLVDPSGNVIGVLQENPGPSKYFARLADNAAREWQFAPADNQGARVWLVRFEFTRGGVATRAIAQ